MEIKVGDKVRIANDAPAEYRYGFNYRLRSQVSEVIGLDDEGFMAAILPLCVNDKDLWFQIPTKYLIKVEDEAKEPKYRFGDELRVCNGFSNSVVSEGALVRVLSYDPLLNNYDVAVGLDVGTTINAKYLKPYTEPTEFVQPKEQTEAEETDTDNIVDNFTKVMEGYSKVFANIADNFDWQRYEADLAKEIALKVANKYSDPKEAADYAVSVAKAVVENLKKVI